MRYLFFALVIIVVYPVLAHDAPALYDNDRIMSLESEVIDLAYRFPHDACRLVIDVNQLRMPATNS